MSRVSVQLLVDVVQGFVGHCVDSLVSVASLLHFHFEKIDIFHEQVVVVGDPVGSDSI